MKSFFPGFLLLVFLVIVPFQPVLAVDIDLPGESALLLCGETGQILYEKDPHMIVEPASITKIMSMILVQEAIERGEVSMDDMVTVSRYAQSMGGSQIYLHAGEQVSVRDLMLAVAISSGNDATVALAEHVAGSEDAFVRLMNRRAQELGMENTVFSNSTGLPPEHGEHHTTAYDIGLMSLEFIQHPELLEKTKIWLDYLDLPGRQAMLVNFNRLVRFYPGVDGIKTGHTTTAGYCIAATAERDDRRFIAVIMKMESEDERMEATRQFLDFAFRAYIREMVVKEGEKVRKLEIPTARHPEVEVFAATTLAPYIRRGGEPVTKEIEIDEELEAPLKAGQVVGTIRAYQKEMFLGEIDIVVKEDTPRAGFLSILWRRFVNFLMNLLAPR